MEWRVAYVAAIYVAFVINILSSGASGPRVKEKRYTSNPQNSNERIADPRNKKIATNNSNKNSNNSSNNKQRNNGSNNHRLNNEVNIPAEYGHDEHKDHGHHGETYRTATEDEIDSVLCRVAHDAIRRIHSVPPLRLDDDLGKGAEIWAKHLAHSSETIKHRGGKELFAENIHQYVGGDTRCGVLNAIEAWYRTIKEYDFNTHIFNESTNLMSMMFMNMVWDDTTRIGCGVARNDEKQKIYVVVRYHPTITDKSPESLKEHVKPPARFLFNKTIDSSKIKIPTMKELAESVPEYAVGILQNFTCNGWSANKREKNPRQNIKEESPLVTYY